jgi:hypothetical protein
VRGVPVSEVLLLRTPSLLRPQHASPVQAAPQCWQPLEQARVQPPRRPLLRRSVPVASCSWVQLKGLRVQTVLCARQKQQQP